MRPETRRGGEEGGEGGDDEGDKGGDHVAALPCGVVIEAEKEGAPCADSEREIPCGTFVFISEEGGYQGGGEQGTPGEQDFPCVGIDGDSEQGQGDGVVGHGDETTSGIRGGDDGDAAEREGECLQEGEGEGDCEQQESERPAAGALSEQESERGDSGEGEHFRADEGKGEYPERSDDARTPLRLPSGRPIGQGGAPDPCGGVGGEKQGHASFHGIDSGPIENDWIEDEEDGGEGSGAGAESGFFSPEVELASGEEGAKDCEDPGDGHEAFVGADLAGDEAENCENPFPEDGGIGAGGLPEGVFEPAPFGEVAREDKMDHDVARELVGEPFPEVVGIEAEEEQGDEKGRKVRHGERRRMDEG